MEKDQESIYMFWPPVIQGDRIFLIRRDPD
jgi:hypothetical protein